LIDTQALFAQRLSSYLHGIELLKEEVRDHHGHSKIRQPLIEPLQ